MNAILGHSRNPTRLFIAIAAVLACVLISSAADGRESSAFVLLCGRLWLGLAVVFWVTRDMRTTSFHPWFEYDAFMFLAWPILLPHYLVRTRGRAGLKLTVWFYASLLAAVVLTAVVRVFGPGHEALK